MRVGGRVHTAQARDLPAPYVTPIFLSLRRPATAAIARAAPPPAGPRSHGAGGGGGGHPAAGPVH